MQSSRNDPMIRRRSMKRRRPLSPPSTAARALAFVAAASSLSSMAPSRLLPLFVVDARRLRGGGEGGLGYDDNQGDDGGGAIEEDAGRPTVPLAEEGLPPTSLTEVRRALNRKGNEGESQSANFSPSFFNGDVSVVVMEETGGDDGGEDDKEDAEKEKKKKKRAKLRKRQQKRKRRERDAEAIRLQGQEEIQESNEDTKIQEEKREEHERRKKKREENRKKKKKKEEAESLSALNEKEENERRKKKREENRQKKKKKEDAEAESLSALSEATSADESDFFVDDNLSVIGSVLLEAFEGPTNLQWSSAGQMWTVDNDFSFGGSYSPRSGWLDDIELSPGPTYSNLTLTTDDDFPGGSLSFAALAQNVRPPRDAFLVSVDEKGDDAAALTADNAWTDHSIAVGQGTHTVTWTYVRNPFGMLALPPAEFEGKSGARIDELRLHPFTGNVRQNFDGRNRIKFVRSGDAQWKIDDSVSSDGTRSMVARTSDISESSGHSDASFVVSSRFGGTIKYKVRTTATAPFDDLAVLVAGERESSHFGLSDGFVMREVRVPPGRRTVTFRHRKNPGNLSREQLEALFGSVVGGGESRVDDVRFEPDR